MKYSYIWEFISLADSVNFTDASIKTGLPVNAIIRHLRSAEDELGVPLILQNPNQKIELTEYGKVFLPYARQLQALYKTSTEITRERQNDNLLLISINTRCKYIREQYIKPWLSENSGTEIFYVSQYTNRLYDSVLHRECDLAVVCKVDGDISMNAMTEIPLAEGWVDVVMLPGNPLSTSDNLVLADITNYNLHVLEADISWVLHMFQSYNMQPFFKYIHPDVHSIIEHMKANDVALMVDEQSKLLSEDINRRPLLRSPTVIYEIIHLPDNKHPLIPKFVNYIISAIQ